MTKLANLTIIPDELYVERSADTQLRRVIDDMGRPAYVLVARQMGKTNLLLHAKRSYQGPLDLFVYLDVSNPLETVSEFFNSIIDAMIDTGRIDDAVITDIYDYRKSNPPLAAHRVHERELRKILDSIQGKVVVFLDEVDALGSRQYSDQVFAYIRSVYFAARTNFPNFNRLSYVLSGVAEPSELIKNKDISPFNIGQKIYLDDFTDVEFSKFCNLAELNFDTDVKNQVYSWTSGNPRMSWDLLSQLQNNDLVTPDSVDAAVRTLYLENFDIPPVDHIRNLVEMDGDLQSALISIHFNKSNAIPSHVVNKLYLGGIAKLNSDSGIIEIRNRIIAESLSLDWLQELEGKNATPIERAYAHYQQGRWADALLLLQECFATVEDDAIKLQLAGDIGVCQFRVQAYDQAIYWFDKYMPKKHVYAALYYEMMHWRGLSYYAINNLDESYKSFSAASETAAEGVSSYYYESLVNCCVYYSRNVDKHAEDIELITGRILNSDGNFEEKYQKETNDANHVRCSAHWHLATLRKRQGRTSDALEQLALAMAIGDKKHSVGIALESARLQEHMLNRWDVANEMASALIEQGYVIESDEALFPLAFTISNASQLLAILVIRPEENIVDRFCDYLKKLLREKSPDYISVLTNAANVALTSSITEGAAKLYKWAYEASDGKFDKNIRRVNLSNSILLTPFENSIDLSEKYIQEYLSLPDSELVMTDFRTVYSIFHGYLSFDNTRSYEILSIFKPLISKFLDQSIDTENYDSIVIGSLIFDYCEIEWNYTIGNQSKASELANLWMEKFKIIKPSPPPIYFSASTIDTISKRIKAIAFSKKIPQFIREGKKIGRNEIVVVVQSDGVKKTGKYKNFEFDIKSGLLKLDK